MHRHHSTLPALAERYEGVAVVVCGAHHNPAPGARAGRAHTHAPTHTRARAPRGAVAGYNITAGYHMARADPGCGTAHHPLLGAGTGTAPRTTTQRSTTRAMRAGGCPTASRSVGKASSPSTPDSRGVDYSTAELPQVEAEM